MVIKVLQELIINYCKLTIFLYTDIRSHCLEGWNGIPAKVFTWEACNNTNMSCTFY